MYLVVAGAQELVGIQKYRMLKIYLIMQTMPWKGVQKEGRIQNMIRKNVQDLLANQFHSMMQENIN